MNLRKLRNQLTDWDKDDLLGLVGLETQRSTMDWMIPALSAFGVGVLVGVGVGMLFAQKPGHELRADLRQRFTSEANAAAATAGAVSEKVGAPRAM